MGKENLEDKVAQISLEDAVVDTKILEKYDLARFGNGHDQDLSQNELDLILELYDRVKPQREELTAADDDSDFCDHETCRRYLVARQWDLAKAESQLISTLKWRSSSATNHFAAKEFWQASRALADPHALNMRIVGLDKDGRPICYTCFAEALDRWDADANLEHLTLLMEATQNLLRTRRSQGLNQTAASRQCVYIIDFDGFGFRDQNPRSGVLTAKLLQHYPETLNFFVLVNAPTVFSGLFRLVSPLLDERVRNKIVFVKGQSQLEIALKGRCGNEAADWIVNEMRDNKEKRAGQKKNPKKYWMAPEREGDHDPRGMASYVKSEVYVKTPGDAFEEQKQRN